MSKRNKIIYWIATVWLSLGLLSSGIVQLFNIKKETEFILAMGYPEYFLTIIGTWKILGVIALLIPKFPLLKEWTYAGCFFLFSGAIYSHMALEHTINEILPLLLLFVLAAVSGISGRLPENCNPQIHKPDAGTCILFNFEISFR